METSWQNITRRLDINKVSRDTTYDKTRGKGRIIKKIGQQFVVPAYSVAWNTVYPPEIWPARIVAQYGFTASGPFRLLNAGTYWEDTTLTRFARLAVRWREGEVGHRYALTKLKLTESFDTTTWSSPDNCDPLPNVEQYTNQRIGAEFVIEVWTHRFYGVGANGAPIGLLRDITYANNKLVIPADMDEQQTEFAVSETLHDTEADGLAQPAAEETLPVDYTGAWNSN